MGFNKVLWTALAGSMFALGSSGAMASAAADCSTITTMGAWETAGTCVIGDKAWKFNSDSLDASVKISFTFIGDTYAMQITGFDNSTAAATWNVNYTISVLDPLFRISDMFAGADNPGGGSTLVKNVTGDAAFSLAVNNGVEDSGSEIHGLTASSLTVDETFHVSSNKTLLSVSDTFMQTHVSSSGPSSSGPPLPEPGTLALLGAALAGLAVLRRRGKSS